MTIGEIEAVLKLRDEMTPQLAKAEASVKGFGSTMSATAAGFVTAQAVIGAAGAAWRTLSGFVSSSVDSFMAAEAAQSRLTAALRAAGQAAPQTIQQYNELASTFQRTTVYGDDLINEMQALLVQVGGVMPGQMEGALKAATNLASGLGIDLRQATMLVGKAFEGETGTLKKYGIVIDEATLKAQGMPAVLDAIQSRFGGQAQAEIETTAGKIKQLANEWDNLKESVGGAIVNDPLVQALMDSITSGSRAAADATAQLATATTELERDQIRAAEAVQQLNLDNDDFFTKAVLTGVPGLRALRQQVDGLRTSYAEAALEATALKNAVNAIPKATGLPTAADVPKPPPLPKELLDGTWERQQKAVNKATSDGAAAAAAYTKSIETLRDSYSGAGLLGELNKAIVAFGGIQNAVKLTKEQKAALQSQVVQLRDIYAAAGKTMPQAMKDLETATRAVIAPVALLTTGSLAWEKSIDEIVGSQRQLKVELNAMPPLLQAIIDDARGVTGAYNDTRKSAFDLDIELRNNSKYFGELVASLPQVADDLIKGRNAWEDYGQALDTASGFLAQFASESKAAAAVSGALGLASSLAAGMSAAGSEKIARAAESAANAVGDVAEAQAQGAAASQAGAAAAASYAGALMFVVSAGLQYMAQQEAERAMERARFDERRRRGRELKEDLIDIYGSLADIDALGQILGVDLARALDPLSSPRLNVSALEIENLSKLMATSIAALFESVETNAGLASEQLLKVIDQLDRMKDAQAEAFIQSNLSDAAGGLSALITGLAEADEAFLKTRAQAEGLASAIVATFGEQLARGVPFREALESVLPAIEALREGLVAAGFEGGAAFAMLDEMARIAGDAIMGPLVDAMSGARNALTGLANTGLLTQESFAAIAASATQAYDQIIAGGGNADASLLMMQPTLQTIWKLQQDFGFAVDEATQALLDQAVAAGIVGEQMLTDAQKQTAATERLAAVMGELLGYFQRLLPPIQEVGKAMDDAAKSAGAAAGGIKDVGGAADSASQGCRNMDEALDLVDESAQSTTETLKDLPLVIDEIALAIATLPKKFDDVISTLPKKLDDIISTLPKKIDDVIVKFDELSKVIGKIPKKIDIEVELKSSGFKSIKELEAIAGEAGRVYQQMVREGGYSASVMQRAFEAWQAALANINPALEGAATAIDRAAAAGYQTRDALEAAAKASGDLYAEMLSSGLYTADTLAKAWEKWQTDLEAAGRLGAAGMTKALREELKGLTEMLEKEAPEEFMGSIERDARARVEAIQRAAKEAAKATMTVAGEATAILTAGASESMLITEGISKNTIKTLQKVGAEGKLAFELVRDAAIETKDEIDDIINMLGGADFGSPFRDWKSDVDALLDSLSRLPTGPGPSGGGSSYSDYSAGSPFDQAAARYASAATAYRAPMLDAFSERAGGAPAGASGGQPIVVHVHNEIGGREVGEFIYEILPGVLQSHGVL